MWSRYKNGTHSDWFFRQLSRYPRFAHHPTCECFDNHLIRIGSRSFCLGCTCLGLGIILATCILGFLHLVSAAAPILHNIWVSLAVGILMYFPCLLQPFLQTKSMKIVFRTMLGMGIVVLWHGAIVSMPWTPTGVTLKIIFALVFVCVFRWTLRFRERYTKSPLTACKRGCYPLCEGNRRHLETLLNQLRQRCGRTDPEFVQFAEGFVCGDASQVDVEHVILGAAHDSNR